VSLSRKIAALLDATTATRAALLANPIPHSPPTPLQNGEPTTPHFWTASELEALEKHLAYYVGPVAKHLVKRAVARARSRDDLLQVLASEVETEPQRQRFIEVCRLAPH
jgi:serine/threonine-protein kinase